MKLKIEIEVGNDAMHSTEAIAHLLRRYSDNIEKSCFLATNVRLLDINGNTAGTAKIVD